MGVYDTQDDLMFKEVVRASLRKIADNVETIAGIAYQNSKKENKLIENNVVEFVGQIIDIFEDFLDEKNIEIPNPDKEDNDNAAIIYGEDYGLLDQKIREAFKNWGLL